MQEVPIYVWGGGVWIFLERNGRNNWVAGGHSRLVVFNSALLSPLCITVIAIKHSLHIASSSRDLVHHLAVKEL